MKLQRAKSILRRLAAIGDDEVLPDVAALVTRYTAAREAEEAADRAAAEAVRLRTEARIAFDEADAALDAAVAERAAAEARNATRAVERAKLDGADEAKATVADYAAREAERARAIEVTAAGLMVQMAPKEAEANKMGSTLVPKGRTFEEHCRKLARDAVRGCL